MNSSKISNKKPLSTTTTDLPKEVIDKINKEYQEEYQKALKSYKTQNGKTPQGMYFRWFDEEMWRVYQKIRSKYAAEYCSSQEFQK